MKLYGLFGLLIGFCLASTSAISSLKRPGKVIIDTDAGGDDALAIFLALVAEEKLKGSGFEVIAITCSYGNTAVTNVEQNVLKVLTIANRVDIPVYGGADKSLIHTYQMDTFFGKDGFGDIQFGEKVNGKIDRSKPASVALIDLARQHAGKVSVIALAPLTNVAIAMKLDPNFVRNVERFYIMGSRPYGRWSSMVSIAPRADFNFYQDPESNFIVLNSTTNPPAVLLPSGISRSIAIPMKWRTETLGALNSRIVQFLNRLESMNSKNPIWDVPDLILVALVLWPELIKSSLVVNMTPVFADVLRGIVVVDYTGTTGKLPNAELLETFDVEGYKQRLLEYFAIPIQRRG